MKKLGRGQKLPDNSQIIPDSRGSLLFSQLLRHYRRIPTPVLFTVYIDDLQVGLECLGVGCYWKSIFAGAVCYADNLTLLAPSPAALHLH